jgi:membrane associated rhomboid family serine protease
VSTAPTGGGAATEGSVPVCPRHPDRESYVRCQRCERPACPQCQRPAAVGIQCVDCVREQGRSTVPVRTAFGGALRPGRPPVVTIAIIAICVVVYILQVLPNSTVTARFEFVPFEATHEPWRLLTAAFLHSPDNLLHIAFNMYALWLVGPFLEAQLGRLRYAALYLISAVGGSIGYLLLASPGNQNQWFVGTVGASGAVFGLFGAFFVVQRRLGLDTGPVVAVIVINFALGFLPGVAWQAHVGGIVTGLACAAALVLAPRVNRARIQWAGLAGVVVLLGVLYAVKVGTAPAEAFQVAQFMGN